MKPRYLNIITGFGFKNVLCFPAPVPGSRPVMSHCRIGYNTSIILFQLAILLILANAAFAAPIFTSDFERGDSGYTFFARVSDSSTGTVTHLDCHGGNGCYAVEQRGSQDWAFYSGGLTQSVIPGEVWTWSVWARIDTMIGSAAATIAAFDSTGKTISWSLSSAAFPKHPTGWAHYQATLVIPTGCAKVTPRVTGMGPCKVVLDDFEWARTKSATPSSPITLSNDSLRLIFDPVSLGITLYDFPGGDSVIIKPLTTFSLDSIHVVSSDSAICYGLYTLGPWPLAVGIRLHGGGVILALHADSSRVLSAPMIFPGHIQTRSGQRLAMPRGTGITIPVEQTTAVWSYRYADFWQWQVSMALVGATDGKTGFVVSFDQPSDASVIWQPTNGLLEPEMYQSPAKGIWDHDRTLLISPLRGGGWKELASRHRSRQRELGRVRTWVEKIQANPKTLRMRGAMDFWFGGTWGKTDFHFFDTLKMYGVDRALIHWNGAPATAIDSLNTRGFLAGDYIQVSGALVGGTSPLDNEIPRGVALDSNGTMINGFQVTDSTGKVTADYKRISIRRELELLRTTLPPDLAVRHKTCQFIDVTLAADLLDDYNTLYPSNRFVDMNTRIRMLGLLRDTLGLVAGSEQTRDFAHAVVDYGEGPMSITYTSDASYDWTTPVAPQPDVESLSFDPSRRVPLLCLSDHDCFAPTWYTGDGQSKIPARWDAKDAWNVLYGTMALIQPKGRTMWDSLQSRYLRSILVVGAAHDRYGFEPMTNFEPLTDDWHIQKTTFGNGWTVIANLDTVQRVYGSDTLAGNGFVARNGTEQISRIVKNGRAQNLVRLTDRWFLEPEGGPTEVDGVRTSGGIQLLKENDTTLQLAMVGNQTAIEILPSSLPWPSNSLRAQIRGDAALLTLSDKGNGWLGLTRDGSNRFYTLHGSFGRLSVIRHSTPKYSARLHLHVLAGLHSTHTQWNQSQPGPAEVVILGLDGRVVQFVRANGLSGQNSLKMNSLAAGLWIVRLRTPDGQAQIMVTLPR